MSAAHVHASSGATASRRHRRGLEWTLVLTTGFLLVEVAGALWTGSLALLADAGHMLTDAAGLGLALLAIWFAAKPATPTKTYGYYRVEILAAFINAIALLGISAYILYEAYRRFLEPRPVIGGPMLAIALVGLAVNLIGVWLLRAGADESLNLKGAYLEVLADALGSLGVILAAVVVLTTGWTLADPIVATGIGLLIVPRTWMLLGQTVNILLEGTPSHLDLAEIEGAMTAVPGVRGVHDLHVWTLTSGKYAMSGHVSVDRLAAADEVLRREHDLLHERFGIDHTTIQLERESLIDIAPLRTRHPAPAGDERDRTS